MAVAAISLAVAAMLGASNLTGARIIAWMTGLMGMLMGAFFIGFPRYPSSPGVPWGAVAVILAVVYLLVVAHPQKVDENTQA